MSLVMLFVGILKMPEGLLSGIRELNPEYLTTRYPDMAGGVPAEMYDEKTAGKHYKTAEETIKWVERQIRKIRDFVSRARKVYRIGRAIFFGSQARGDNFKDSDYDIILVSEDFKNMFFTKRMADMYPFWKHYPLEIEPICCTPEEFAKKSKEHGMVRQAIKGGIEI